MILSNSEIKKLKKWFRVLTLQSRIGILFSLSEVLVEFNV
jgi:hypothetical protein